MASDGKYYLPDAYVKTGYSGFDPNIPVSDLRTLSKAFSVRAKSFLCENRDVAPEALVAALEVAAVAI